MIKDLKIVASGLCHIGMNQRVSGTRRLGQKFLIELLTEAGSMEYLPHRGCNFLSRLRHTAYSEYDVVVAFSAACARIARTLRAEETGRIPPDERFAGAQMAQMSIESGSLCLELVVRSRAGTSVRVITPSIQV